jgi:sugar-specific transcriptional regulator TrmB
MIVLLSRKEMDVRELSQAMGIREKEVYEEN